MKDIKKLPIILAVLLICLFASFPNMQMEIKFFLIAVVLCFNTFIVYKLYKQGLITKERVYLLSFFVLLTILMTIYFLSRIEG